MSDNFESLVAKYQCNPSGRLSTFEAIRNQMATAHRLCNENYDWAKGLEAKLARLTTPTVYSGAYYASVKTPERCPDCDSRDFISHGATSMICKSCWLTAELEKVEAKVTALEAENGRLKAPVSDEEWEKYSLSVKVAGPTKFYDNCRLAPFDHVNDLLAARAQQSSPAQDKEQATTGDL